jgi:hypothetical protein
VRTGRNWGTLSAAFCGVEVLFREVRQVKDKYNNMCGACAAGVVGNIGKGTGAMVSGCINFAAMSYIIDLFIDRPKVPTHPKPKPKPKPKSKPKPKPACPAHILPALERPRSRTRVAPILRRTHRTHSTNWRATRARATATSWGSATRTASELSALTRLEAPRMLRASTSRALARKALPRAFRRRKFFVQSLKSVGRPSHAHSFMFLTPFPT